MIVQGLEEIQFEANFAKDLQRPISSASRKNSLALCLSDSYAVDIAIMCLKGEILIIRSINDPEDNKFSTAPSLGANGLVSYLKAPLLSPQARQLSASKGTTVFTSFVSPSSGQLG